MLVPDRRRRVLEQVRRDGAVQVETLAAQLGVSPWTVRRDLAELESRGLLTRAHGGAFLEGTAPAARPTDGQLTQKQAIARAAADRIPDSSTIMVLAGSTTAELAPNLRGKGLTVVTNGLEIAYSLKDAEDVAVVVVGGYLHREQMTLLGPQTTTAMADIHVDLIVAGAYGVHPEIGVTGAKIIQAGYHHEMLKHTDALMVLADSSKLGRTGPTVLAGLSAVDLLVTDSGAPGHLVADVRERGVAVVLA